MKRIALLFLVLVQCLMASADIENDKSFRLDVEGALAWQTLNRNQIPNSSSGTRFDLADFNRSAIFAPRFYLTYQLSPKHSLRALVFPFQTSGSKTFDNSINFDGATFVSGRVINGKYRFHSYRLTYRYEFLKNEDWVLKLGFTAKIRNALVSLSQGTLVKDYSNIGFVPLLNFNAKYLLNPTWRLEFDMDALAAPQGRAEDIAIQTWHSLSNEWDIGVGYRTLEGGADNSKVYTFAWLHFITLTAAWSW